MDFERAQTNRLRGHRASYRANCLHDLDVLLLDLRGERDPLEQVLKAAGVEHDADEVRTVRLVAVDQLPGQHRLVPDLICLELGKSLPGCFELDAGAVQFGDLRVQLGLDSSDLPLQACDARIQVSQAARGDAELAGEVRDPALAGADLLLQLANARGLRHRRMRRTEYDAGAPEQGRGGSAGGTFV